VVLKKRREQHYLLLFKVPKILDILRSYIIFVYLHETGLSKFSFHHLLTQQYVQNVAHQLIQMLITTIQDYSSGSAKKEWPGATLRTLSKPRWYLSLVCQTIITTRICLKEWRVYYDITLVLPDQLSLQLRSTHTCLRWINLAH